MPLDQYRRARLDRFEALCRRRIWPALRRTCSRFAGERLLGEPQYLRELAPQLAELDEATKRKRSDDDDGNAEHHVKRQQLDPQ